MNEQIKLHFYERSVGRYLNSEHVSSENQHNKLILSKLMNEIASSFGRRLLQTTHEVLVSPRIKLRARFCSRHFLNLISILRIIRLNLLLLASGENHRTKLNHSQIHKSKVLYFWRSTIRAYDNRHNKFILAK